MLELTGKLYDEFEQPCESIPLMKMEEHSGLVVIDLYADWCGPCKMLAPTLHALEEEYPEVKFAKVNVDKETALAMQFKVQSIPFVAFVKDNTFLDMSVGIVDPVVIQPLLGFPAGGARGILEKQHNAQPRFNSLLMNCLK